MYAVYHGPEGLRAIATRVHRYAAVLARALGEGGVPVEAEDFFDTITAVVPGRAADVVASARQLGLHLRLVDADRVGLSTSEVTTRSTLTAVLRSFGVSSGSAALDLAGIDQTTGDALPDDLRRTTPYLTHEVFSSHHSETAMLRYLRRLSARDYALDRGMIPLGSCTMKLNATTEMEPVSLPGFADLHPFAPAEDAVGYRHLVEQLEEWLAEVTGYDRVSIQPNAGSQGELAGLLAIRGYHRARGEGARNVCLIPSSAHGTNAASAVMAGMKVVVVKAGEDGSVDLDDLKAQCDAHSDGLAAIMVDLPVHPRRLRGHDHRAVRGGALPRRPGVRRWRQPQRPARLRAAGRVRRRRLPPQPAQDVLHPARWRRSRRRAGRGARAPRAVPPLARAAPRRGEAGRHRPDQRRALRLGRRAADLVGLHPADGRGRPRPRDGGRGAVGQLRRAPAGEVLPGALPRPRWPGRARVHPRPARADQGHRRDRRRRREAADRLRLPRADHVVPGRRHAHGRAHRVRGPRRDRPVHRRDDRDPQRDRPGRRGGVDSRGVAAARRPAHRPGAGRQVEARLPARARRVFPTGPDPDKYWPPVARIDQAYGDRNLVCACPPPEAFAE